MKGSGGSFGFDAVVAAIVLSAALHAALMFWASPKVMTHVVSGDVKGMRRPPSAVSRADAARDPVSLDMVEDLPAQREAPDAEDVQLAAPAPDDATPVPPDAAPLPATVSAPPVLDRMRPDVEAPVLPPPTPAAKGDKDAIAAMPFESSAPASGPSYSGGALASGPALDPVSSPSMALPPSAPPPPPPPDPVADAPDAIEPPDAGKPAFKPLDEVMPSVDEAIVAGEKAAVRDIVDVPTASDLAAVVDARPGSCAVDGEYTYFKAVVTPRAVLRAVPKDVVILIDASGSIGNDRLSSCRKAARRILRTCTNTGDRFNLVAFRDRFTYAFKTWKECDAESFDAGDKWLSRLAAHGRTDVFATISSVLTLPRTPARPLVALVVTDGEANVGVKGNDEIISRFTALNDGLVSVYMYGVKSSANRELIDLLTRGNRGESFVFDGWRWNAGSEIESLSSRFRDPVMTDLRVVFPSSCPAEAYPALLRNLYAGNSVEIVGRVKGRPREVSFSLRGQAAAEAYEGYFTIPLGDAPADPALPGEWRRERDLGARLSNNGR